MSVIRPFAGLRPTPEMAADVAAPPYDVLSSDEARELVKHNPNSFLRVNKSEVDFPPDADVYGQEIYERGRENLQRLIAHRTGCRDRHRAPQAVAFAPSQNRPAHQILTQRHSLLLD